MLSVLRFGLKKDFLVKKCIRHAISGSTELVIQYGSYIRILTIRVSEFTYGYRNSDTACEERDIYKFSFGDRKYSHGIVFARVV